MKKQPRLLPASQITHVYVSAVNLTLASSVQNAVNPSTSMFKLHIVTMSSM